MLYYLFARFNLIFYFLPFFMSLFALAANGFPAQKTTITW